MKLRENFICERCKTRTTREIDKSYIVHCKKCQKELYLSNQFWKKLNNKKHMNQTSIRSLLSMIGTIKTTIKGKKDTFSNKQKDIIYEKLHNVLSYIINNNE